MKAGIHGIELETSRKDRLLDVELIEFGGIFMLMTLAAFTAYAVASAALGDLMLAAPAARRWIERTFGAILIGFAAKLAFTDR